MYTIMVVLRCPILHVPGTVYAYCTYIYVHVHVPVHVSAGREKTQLQGLVRMKLR